MTQQTVTQQNDELDFLIFTVGGQSLALPGQAVSAVLTPRAVTPLPFVPDYIEGLVHVGDRVLMLVNAGMLLSLTGAVAVRNELLVLETGSQPCALRIDRVTETVTVPANVFQSRSPSGDDTALALAVAGHLDHQGQQLAVLAPRALAELLGNNPLPQGEHGLLGDAETTDRARRLDQQSCLHFTLNNEHYGFNLTDVAEVLDFSPVTTLPGAPSWVMGMARVRDEALLVLSLASLLGTSQHQPPPQSRILVLERDGHRYGLHIDRIVDIQSYDETQLRPVEDRSAEVSALLAIDNQLIGLLSPATVLSEQRREPLLAFLPISSHRHQQKQQTFIDLLEVRLGDEPFAVPLEQVFAIADQVDFEALEQEDGSLVSGAVHIKGEILPVVDYGNLLQCKGHQATLDASRNTHHSNHRQAWLVVGDDDNRWVIPVTQACQILRLEESTVETIEQSRQGYIAAIARMQHIMMPVISLAPLQHYALQHGQHPANHHPAPNGQP